MEKKVAITVRKIMQKKNVRIIQERVNLQVLHTAHCNSVSLKTWAGIISKQTKLKSFLLNSVLFGQLASFE